MIILLRSIHFDNKRFFEWIDEIDKTLASWRYSPTSLSLFSMVKIMFSFLKKNPLDALEKDYKSVLEKAMQAQRKGDIKLYSELTDKADKILLKIDEIK